MRCPYPSTALVVVDSTVKDYQGLLNSVSSNTKVLVLDAAQDGIEQVTAELRNYHDLSSLHILAHGEPGVVHLGSSRLSLATLERYANQLRSWAQAIATDANILLYGCRVAAGTVGQTFVQQLSQLVNVPIAASTTLTGNALMGGDWSLEFATGKITAPLAFASAATATYPHVLAVPVNLLTETFTGNDVVDKRWLFGVDDAGRGQRNPFLTARNTADAPTGGLPGNPSPGTAPYPALDAEGNGVLRLTNVANNQAAYVLYNNPLPASAGLTIEFDLFSYGGSGADGISFFLADGANPPTRAGGFGGSLGYAQINADFQGPGVQGGYLGIGFDEYGNYSNPTESRVGGTTFTPDAIAIRGSQANDYAYLTGTGVNELPYSIDVPNAANRDAAGRRVRIQLTPTGLLSVQVDANRDGDYTDPGESPTALQNYNIVAANGELPDTFTFGFASGTGIFTNNHEIRNLQVSQPTSPPEVADATINVRPGNTINVTGLSATDADGTIVSYTIATTPAAEQGTLYLGNPTAGGTPVTVGQVLTPDQISQVFFQPAAGFTGASFTYNATDDIGAVDQTPGTVTLALRNTPGNDLPVARNVNAELDPNSTTRLPTLRATDPDGTIDSFTIVSLPSITQGRLYLGDPTDGGRLVRDNETLTPSQVSRLYFRADPDFTGGTFTFYATDNQGGISNIATATLDDGVVEPVNPGDGTCEPGIRRRGTGGNNRLRGTSDIDTLLGGSGNDTLRGLSCPDLLQGQRGRDRILGGNAGDNIQGNQSNDWLQGENGNDTLNGGLGSDRINGGRGSDVITSYRGRDRISGLAGNDLIITGRDRDTVRGGAGDDWIEGRQDFDRVDGNNGNDYVRGNLGRDTLTGGSGADTLNGGRANDRLLGNSSDDFILANLGNDRLYGGSQTDYLSGGEGRDILVGGGDADTLDGGAGRDRFVFKNVTHGGDLIAGFQRGDVFDFSRIFNKPGYSRTGTFAYIQQGSSGSDVVIRLDANGDRAGGFIDYFTVQSSTSAYLQNGGQITARNFLV